MISIRLRLLNPADVVKNALTKDGWTITEDPLYISFGGVELYVDLGAEKIIGAEKEGQKIAVEIKSFVGTSTIHEFHTALGQYLNYRLALEEQNPERTLYLAIPEDTYLGFFTLQFGQTVIERFQLKLIVYHIEKEEIVQWVHKTDTENSSNRF